MEVQHNSCPKCGCNRLDIFAVMDKTGDYVCVGCKKCRFKGPLVRTKAEAWLSWDIAMSIIKQMEKDKTEKEDSTKKPTTRKNILDAAATCVCKERNNQYGEPEDCFQDIANLWAAYKGVDFDPFDVAMMMSLLKVMADADAVIMCGKGVVAARGCRMEFHAADEYEIPIYYMVGDEIKD